MCVRVRVRVRVTANAITGGATVAAGPVRIYEEKGNHILTFIIIEFYATCICLILSQYF